MKKIITTISLLLLLSSSLVSAKITYPLLLLDMRNAPQLPQKFRAVTDTVPANINTTGLADLHIAGGAQFSKASLTAILSHLHTRKMLVIDLRQESHGMLNSNAISWYGKHNAENADKNVAQIEEEQATLLKKLGEEQVATVDSILKKSANGEIKKVKPVEYLVHQTSSEQELVTGMKLKYKRIFVQDYHAPTEKEVDHFIEIVKHAPGNQWIYLHCRAGVGRTTMFMIMFDMLHNAKQVSFEDILARQIALNGKDIFKLPEKKHYKYAAAVERAEFIKKFYEYAKGNKDNYHTSWSQWLGKG